MDHLPPPIDGHRVKVPFYAKRRKYRPGDFYSLPKEPEYGYQVQKLVEEGLDPQMDPKKANEFLQSWLFFCLLAHVLDCTIDHRQFLTHDGGALQTTELKDLLLKWAEDEKANAKQSISREQRDRYFRASVALSQGRKFVSKHLSTHRRIDREDFAATQDTPTLNCDENEASSGLETSLDTRMTLSLAVLGETLEHARPDMLPELLRNDLKFWRDTYSQEESWGYSKWIRDTMRENGHCPLSIRRLEAIMPTVSILYYAISMKSTNQHQDTSKCTSQSCNARPKYSGPLHMDCDGNPDYNALDGKRINCKRFEFGEEELVRIISSGKTPMVKFSTSNGLEHVEYDLNALNDPDNDQEPFGVLSHTWDEAILHSGLDLRNGNDRSMHECQLIRLQDTLNRLLNEIKDIGMKPTNYPFFVDVLCFPRQLSVQKLAIQQLRDIYRKSSAVLVWDRNLLERNRSDDDLIEINMRIRTCDWPWRLWTLQEAVLAKRLYVALKRGATVSIQEVQKARDKARNNTTDSFHYIWKAGHPFSLPVWDLRPETRSTGTCSVQLVEQDSRVARVWQAVQYRQVSQPEDEAVVLASVLGVDVGVIQDIGESERDKKTVADQRMAKLLDQIEEDPALGIPSGIVYLPGPKLPIAGQEWAPKTWLSKQSHPYPLFRPLRKTAQSTRRGVLVTFPGLVLHCPTDTPDSIFHVPLHETFHKWFKVQAAVNKEDWPAFWENEVRIHNELCIVLSAANPRDRWEAGILVRSKGRLREGQVRWVEVLCRVWVRLETDLGKVAKLSIEYTEKPEKLTFGSRLKDDQDWCVDRSSN